MKVKVTTPHDTAQCEGGKCGHKHEHIIDVPDPIPEQIQNPGSATMQILEPPKNQFAQGFQPQPVVQPPQNKKLSHEELEELIPKGINAISCPGGDCGHKKLKNPIKTKKYKTCPNGNCGANTVPKNSEFCPYCTKNIDEDEDLEDGVDLSEEDEE